MGSSCKRSRSSAGGLKVRVGLIAERLNMPMVREALGLMPAHTLSRFMTFSALAVPMAWMSIVNGAVGTVLRLNYARPTARDQRQGYTDTTMLKSIAVQLDSGRTVMVRRSKVERHWEGKHMYWKATFPLTLAYAITGECVLVAPPRTASTHGVHTRADGHSTCCHLHLRAHRPQVPGRHVARAHHPGRAGRVLPRAPVRHAVTGHHTRDPPSPAAPHA